MSTFGFIILFYGVISLLALRLLGGHYTYVYYHYFEMGLSAPGPEHYICGYIVGLFAALLWPIALLYKFLPTIGLEKEEERKRSLQKQEENIRNLEKELNL